MKRKFISAFILSCTISLMPSQVMAQNQSEADNTTLFRGVAVSADLIGLGQILWSDYGQYEAGARINLKDKYFPVVEIGYGKCDTEDITTQNRFKTQAPYFKLGCDFNVMKNKHDDYRVYVGGRYAFSSYKYDFESNQVIDPIWGTNTPFSQKDISGNCSWLEAGVGIDAKIFGPIRLGWSVRYRQRMNHKEGTSGKAYYVPGFGKNDTSNIGGTFNVIFEL